MIYENTSVEGFTLMGYYEFPNFQFLLSFGFLTVYFLCILENIILIILVCLNSQLHSPMYFFLCNLLFLDICLTTLIHPKFLLTFLNMRSISYHECMGQLYLYIAFQSLEYLLLTVMSYDRYVAICNPIHYNIILNRKFCVILAVVTWLISLVDPVPVMRLVTNLPFCKSRKINHLFCDSVALLKLACGSITRLEFVIHIEGGILASPAFLFTLYTYVSIISVILKIQTAKGRLKAFSTCSSHLTVVSMLYVSLACMYILPSSTQSINDSKTVSLLNIVLIPMLNPVLYSLRNKDVKNAFLKLIKQKKIPAN